jgi:hypothetical protein
MTTESSDIDDSIPVAVVCCAVLEEEVRTLIPKSSRIAAIRVLPQGLHSTPTLLRQRLQETIDELECSSPAQVITLVYGLCSRGTEGVVARRARLVLPRAHDCITLLLGSRQRYAEYVRGHPGTYWYSPGWNRHHLPPGQERFRAALEEYRKRFSEEDAQYLMETEQAWFTQYDRATYVHLGLADPTDDVTYTRRCADWLGWSFDQQHGDPQLLKELIAGPWDDERFLVLEPGETATMTADDRIVDRVLPRHAVTVRGRRQQEAAV